MTSGLPHAHRLAVIEAARMLAHDATAAARDCDPDSSRREFYLGAKRAALHVLMPEMSAVREGTPWLERESQAFRDGFLDASNLLATAAAGAQLPARLPLPHPPG